ncbi:MAG: hypothetical protein QOC95_2014 [Thermoleophilaceae bacterium]|jgi:hypothetical protein|nr:hypothetical protein [Thermoleophilaceae bacterium]
MGVAIRPIDASPHPVAPPVAAPRPTVNLALERQVQNALNLFLPLKSPAQMPALLATVQAAKPQVNEALASLHYVHFARFLPSQDMSTLMVITEYDGGLESYIMDFVAVMGDVFTQILTFVAGAPRLPVQQFPREFTEFVFSHNNSRVGVWSAYPDATVLDVLHGTSRL